MIIDPNTVERDLDLQADACIVGTGAAGAVIARELAEAGLKVIALEEGRYNRPSGFTQREADMFSRLYREQASRATADFSVLVVQGRTVGGSTVPSFCINLRPPAAILDAWEQKLGLAGVGSALMAPYFERVEKAIAVRAAGDDEVNANNARLRDGAMRLGLRGKLLAHSRVDCVGCGFCALGCAYDRKNDGLTVYVPAASRAGAAVIPQCTVEGIERKGSRVTGVHAVLQRDDGRSTAVRVQARAVILAAGAIGSTRLWLRNGLPDAGRRAGRHLHLHPQVVVQAEFAEAIEGWNGVPQTYAVDQFVRNEPGGGGFWVGSLFVHPLLASTMTSGVGDEHRQWMEAYRHVAMAAVTLHDRSEGRVTLDDQGRATVDYHLVEDDRADLIEGIRRAAEIFFAAGAKRVMLPFADRVVLESSRDTAAMERAVRASDPLLVSYQPHGTLRMGREPRDSVVAATGQAHEVRGLWVADASLFPTAVAVPPQLAVMAFATRVADQVAKALGTGG